MNGTATTNQISSSYQKALQRYITTWDYAGQRPDELTLVKGDILLAADSFDDGWIRGLRLKDLEIGFFPSTHVAEDVSPIYRLKEIPIRSVEDYRNDPKFSEIDSSKRSKIALEFFTSEETYLKKLRMLNEKFVQPLKDQTIIPQENYSPIFSHIQPLVSLAESLAIQLKSRMEAWNERVTRIGDLFVHLGAHFKLFVTYAVHHTLGRQVLQKISKQEKFQKWLEKTELECQRTLDSLLLEPIQRVPRYELLLKDLFRNTNEDHPDFAALKDGLSLVQKILTDCNENVRRAENELHLYAISKRFPNDDVDVVQARKVLKKARRDGTLKKRKTSIYLDTAKSSSSLSFRSFFESEHQRQFIKEGPIFKVHSDFSDPQDRYLFLCSDVLLIAQATNKARRSFRLKERVPLVHAWLTDTFSLNSQKIPNRGFIFGSPQKTYRFLAATPEEKEAWYAEIHKQILAQKQLFGKLLTHLSTPDEVYYCTKVKTRVNYIGMFKDELSFKSGDELMIIGYRDSSGKWKSGLYSSEEPFDPASEWHLGILNNNYGWFPAPCIHPSDMKAAELPVEELAPAPLNIVFHLKQRMVDLTGREIPPLRENERVAKVYTGTGVFKTLRIPMSSTIEDIVRMYFRVEDDMHLLSWNLLEVSMDETVERVLDSFEDPSKVVDFWGKNRDQMKFFLRQTAYC